MGSSALDLRPQGPAKKIGGGENEKEAPSQTRRKNQKTKGVSDYFFIASSLLFLGGENVSLWQINSRFYLAAGHRNTFLSRASEKFERKI
jgi:hypothetical protein